jgi:hypothetical protein|tara:strand:+ start:2886 stop:3329 length:444 start_codon:yes stop_codon:yes gene_type:complete
MNFDELKECTRCGSDACYKQEINKEISIEMCYGCGFQSNSLMKNGSDFFNEQLETLPEIYKVLMDEEEDTGKIWMPSTINVKEKGMVFATGQDRDSWRWGAVTSIKIPKKDREKYKGEKYRADMSTIKYFQERDFIEALSYIGILPK